MHKIQIDNDIYEIPESWSELTSKELLYLARLTQQDISAQELKLKMFLFHLKGKVGYHQEIYKDSFRIQIGVQSNKVSLRTKKKSYLLSPDHINQVIALYNFLYDYRYLSNGKKECIILPDLQYENPLPEVCIYLRKFKGPCECLYDITFEQFMFLQTYLNKLNDSPDAIHQVLACLWHRGKEWSAANIERDAKKLRTLSAEKKMVMYWFITSCLGGWAQSFPDIFAGDGKSINGVFDNQQRLLNMLANGDITKKMEVRRSNIWDAFYVIDEACKRKREAEKKE